MKKIWLLSKLRYFEKILLSKLRYFEKILLLKLIYFNEENENLVNEDNLVQRKK